MMNGYEPKYDVTHSHLALTSIYQCKLQLPMQQLGSWASELPSS